jgi:hypothetical protein
MSRKGNCWDNALSKVFEESKAGMAE